MHLWNFDFWQRQHDTVQKEKLEKLFIHRKKKRNWILTHTRPKNQLQMDEALKCQKQTLKTWKENRSEYLPELEVGKNLWRYKKC